MKKRVHIIGVAGKTTAALAKLFKKDLGWEVTGSDHKKIYEPAKSYLKSLGVEVNLGYGAKNIPFQLNLIIIGASALIVDKDNPEYEEAKKRSVEMISYNQAMERFFVKDNSVCIAGTYGKTTITALVAWIFRQAKRDFSYFIGEQPNNFKDYLEVGSSDWSIMEADEYAPRALVVHSGPRFHHFKPKYILITAIEWEHKDVYQTEDQYFQAFVDFINKAPKDGLLVVNQNGKNINRLLGLSKLPRVTYSAQTEGSADWRLMDAENEGELTRLLIKGKTEEIELRTSLLGKYNWENICGAVALCKSLGVETKAIQEAVKTYTGVKRRLELLGKFGKVYFYDDFAQSATRVVASLGAIRSSYPKKKIVVIFDPHASALGKIGALEEYEQAFCQADEVFISKVTFYKKIPKKDWVKGSDWAKMLGRGCVQVEYLPLAEDLVGKVLKTVKEETVIVFMSSGGLYGEGIKKEIIKQLRNRVKIS